MCYLTEKIVYFHFSVVSELIDHQSHTKELRDKNGDTPLHLACKNGHLEVAKMLLNPHLLKAKYANFNIP